MVKPQIPSHHRTTLKCPTTSNIFRASAKMRCLFFLPLPSLLPISAIAAVLLLPSVVSSSTTTTTTCPYDIPTSTAIIPQACYANYTASATAPATNCCWFVFAAYIFAVIRHSNATGVAFLPSDTASTCSDEFANYIRSHGLVSPSFQLNADRCNLNGEDPSELAAGKRACQYSTVADIRSKVNLTSGVRLCTSSRKDLTSDQKSCNSCQNSVIDSTVTLLEITNSDEFVPCGMAASIGIWSSSPQIGRFRSYAICMVEVLDNVGTLGPIRKRTIAKTNKKSHRAIAIATSSAAAGLLFIAAIVVLVIAIRRRKRSEPGDRTVMIESALPKEGLYIFSKSELKQATNGFDSRLLLGEGGAGKVYLGKLPSGQHVAIKRIQLEKKLGEFYREIEILAKLRHRNLTTLVGYCLQKKEHVLVYEYMPGGNLSRALHHSELTWHRRVQIAVDIAEGLAYLHEFPDGAVVHRDVKPTNVLLTDSGVAKLSDFGVSKILPSEISHVSTAEIKGTMGYLDPETFSIGQVSEATDVYSFGIVLLELITGMRAVVPTPSGGAESIVYRAHEVMMAGDEPDVGGILDPRLEPDPDRVSVGEVFKVAYRCVKPYKHERPRMKEVLRVLKGVLADIENVGSTEVGEMSAESASRVTTPSLDAWSL